MITEFTITVCNDCWTHVETSEMQITSKKKTKNLIKINTTASFENKLAIYPDCSIQKTI